MTPSVRVLFCLVAIGLGLAVLLGVDADPAKLLAVGVICAAVAPLVP